MGNGNTRTMVAEVFPSNVHRMTTPTGERVTTNKTIGDDLRHSLSARGVHVGETWGDFKRAVEALGVQDDHVFASCEYGNAQNVTGRVVATFNEDGVELREVR